MKDIKKEKERMEEKEKWYNPQKMLSDNKIHKVIISERGSGKRIESEKRIENERY